MVQQPVPHKQDPVAGPLHLKNKQLKPTRSIAAPQKSHHRYLDPMMLSVEMEAIVLVKQRETLRESNDGRRTRPHKSLRRFVGWHDVRGELRSRAGEAERDHRSGLPLDCENRAGGRTGCPLRHIPSVSTGAPFEWRANLISAIGDRPNGRRRRTARWDWWLLEKLTAEHIHLGRARLPFRLPRRPTSKGSHRNGGIGGGSLAALKIEFYAWRHKPESGSRPSVRH